MATELFNATLQESKFITPNVKHFRFAIDKDNWHFIPGQFISIHFPTLEKPIRRSYSIASIPNETNHYIDFAASYVEGGFASEKLFKMELGEVVSMSGPYGRLILREEPVQRLLLIATGTGVTPYRAMLPELVKKLAANPDLEIWILLGVQFAHDQLYSQDFLYYTHHHNRLNFRIYYSQEKFDHHDRKNHEFSGRIQTAFSELKPDPTRDIVYLCGNPNMIDDSYQLLQGLGFTAQQVRREKYVS